MKGRRGRRHRRREIDGISGYADDRNDASHLATALGLQHLGFAGMVWGGGGGGGSGAVGNAAAAVAAGYAKYCVVFRALAQGQFGRFGQAAGEAPVSGAPAYTAPYGSMFPRNGSRCARAASCTIRHQPGTARGGRARRLLSRAIQSARRDVRASAHARGVRQVALDRRAVPSLRLLYGERRVRRVDS